jgi:Tol biopolymer transport system component
MKPALFVSCCCCLLAAAPASAQVVRVSVSTAGVEGNQFSSGPTISGDGRYVAFYSAADNLVANDTNFSSDIFLRDRDTDADGVYDEPAAVATTRLSVGTGGAQANAASYLPVMTPDARYVFFVSSATNIVAGMPASSLRLFRLDRSTGTTILVAPDAAFLEFYAASANGDVVVYRSTTDSPRLTIRQISTQQVSLVPAPYAVTDPATQTLVYSSPSISADGNRIAYITGVSTTEAVPFDRRAYVFDRETGASTLVAADAHPGVTIDAAGRAVGLRFETRIAKRVIASGAETASFPIGPVDPLTGRYYAMSPSGRWDLAGSLLADYVLGVSTPLPIQVSLAAFSADDRWLAFATQTPTLVGGDTNNVEDVFVMDIPDYFDADDDTMDDRWETLFSVTDPSADPDGDLQTNAQEENAGTHPNGQVSRFLAEGATGAFFHTSIALANPSLTLAASAVLTFDRGNGTRVRRSIAIPAGRSTVVDIGAVAGLEAADVSTTVESDRLLGVNRSMTWGDGVASAIYGSHAEAATATPAATWFLAEGSTVLGFDLFYMLQNPQATTTQATVRYLLPTGTVISRIYNLAPGSRTTIYVNQISGLEETDVSGDITADAPIVVERAMYRGAPDRPFALGHEAMGVTATATSWFLAEGATGNFFDLFVLLANPSGADATVQARYARPDGSTVTQSYTVRANSRFSVYVDAIPGLESTSVATTLTSTVPIVAERSMYWPGGFFDYYEGHSSAGSTTTATEWVVGGGENGGSSATQTFVLVANTAATAGEATLTVLPDRGFTGTVPAPIVVALPANSRTTVPLTVVDGAFGVRVVSTGGAPVPLVVESAVYRSADGVLWSAGSNALATPILP